MKNKQINVKLTYAENSTLPRVVGRVICANRGKGLSLTQGIAQYELAFVFYPKAILSSMVPSTATHGREMVGGGPSHPLSQDAEAPEPLLLAKSHGLTGDATQARPRDSD